MCGFILLSGLKKKNVSDSVYYLGTHISETFGSISFKLGTWSHVTGGHINTFGRSGLSRFVLWSVEIGYIMVCVNDTVVCHTPDCLGCWHTIMCHDT